MKTLFDLEKIVDNIHTDKVNFDEVCMKILLEYQYKHASREICYQIETELLDVWLMLFDIISDKDMFQLDVKQNGSLNIKVNNKVYDKDYFIGVDCKRIIKNKIRKLKIKKILF